jgi:tetratricopeptide (TPR) repeat protein
MDTSENPIAERLARLADEWDAFSGNPDARLLRWLFAPDEMSMLDTFIAFESSEHGELSDLFIRFTTPFTRPHDHGARLVEELKAWWGAGGDQNDESQTPEPQEPLPPWNCPDRLSNENDYAWFVRALESLHPLAPAGAVERIVAIFTPESVSDFVLYRKWLYDAVKNGMPASVRFALIDNAAQPNHDELCAALPREALSTPADLDMDGALCELAAEGEGPGVDYRKNYVAAATSLNKKDIATAEQHVQNAVAIAEQNDWPHLACVAWALLACGHQGLQQFDEAIDRFHRALEAAQRAIDIKEPSGPKIQLQALFGEAGAFFQAKRYGEAAALYEQAGNEAQALGEKTMALDGFRMASFCHEQDKEFDEAWRTGETALTAGENIDEKERSSSSLPWLGQALMRVTKKWSLRKYRDEVDERMTALLGQGWLEALEQGGRS